jgi:DNA-binding transcriptional LysR family regulator
LDARAWSRGIDGALRIACPLTMGGPVISSLIEAFCADCPECDVTLHEVYTWDPYAGLRNGEVDVLINWQVVDEPDLVAGPVLEYRERVLAMRPGHRLAKRESVSFEELADEETHSPPYPEKFPAALAGAILPTRTPSGRPIRRTRRTWSLEDIVAVVSRTDIVHPTMAGVALLARRYRPGPDPGHAADAAGADLARRARERADPRARRRRQPAGRAAPRSRDGFRERQSPGGRMSPSRFHAHSA